MVTPVQHGIEGGARSFEEGFDPFIWKVADPPGQPQSPCLGHRSISKSYPLNTATDKDAQALGHGYWRHSMSRSRNSGSARETAASHADNATVSFGASIVG